MPVNPSASDEVIVVVHPSWPFESLDSVAPRLRRSVRDRCELVLFRIADCLNRPVKPTAIVVGPFLCGGSFLSACAADSLRFIREAAQQEIDGGLDQESLREAGKRIAAKWQTPRRIRVCGFYRDLCCLEVLAGLAASGRHTLWIDRTLSRCAPPEA